VHGDEAHAALEGGGSTSVALLAAQADHTVVALSVFLLFFFFSLVVTFVFSLEKFERNNESFLLSLSLFLLMSLHLIFKAV
jgi:hypothetical protein